MANLKAGTLIGGNMIWNSGNMPLRVDGSNLFINSVQVYTKSYKPTPADVGAVNKAGDTMSGTLVCPNGKFGAVGCSNESSSSGNGISLYSNYNGGAPAYGLMFAGTATFGKHGAVTGDWATYFTMALGGSGERGWIFRKANATNVASVSVDGVITGSDVRVGSNKVYHDGNKPSASTLGVVNKSGDTMTGKLLFDAGANSYIETLVNADNGISLYVNPSTPGTYGAPIRILRSRHGNNETTYNELVHVKESEGGGYRFQNVTPNASFLDYRSTIHGSVFIDTKNSRIFAAGTASDENHLVNKKYADTKLSLSGGTMAGAIIAGNINGQFRGRSVSGVDLDSIHSETQGEWGYSIVSSTSTNLFPAANNANGLLTFNCHNGKYGRQIGFSSNGAMYTRYNDRTTWSSWRKMYDEANKPTATELGVVSRSGDTMTGRLNLNGSDKQITFVSDKNYIAMSGDSMYLSANGTNGLVTLECVNNPKVRLNKPSGREDHTLYHTGNKPSATDVGADKRFEWKAKVKKGTWSVVARMNVVNLGSQATIMISHTRNGVVHNSMTVWSGGHSKKGQLTQLSGHAYSQIQLRVCSIDSNNTRLEILDKNAGTDGDVNDFTIVATNVTGSLEPVTSFTETSGEVVAEMWTAPNAMKINNHLVYHEGNKPTVSDIGAAPEGFGLGAAGLTKADANEIGHVGGFFGAGGDTGKNYYNKYAPLIQAFRAGGGDGSGQIVQMQEGDGTIAFRNRSNNVWSAWTKLYSTNFKPTAAEVGALPIGGGVLTGQLQVKDGMKSALAIRDGASIRFADGGAVWLHLRQDGPALKIFNGNDTSQTESFAFKHNGLMHSAGRPASMNEGVYNGTTDGGVWRNGQGVFHAKCQHRDSSWAPMFSGYYHDTRGYAGYYSMGHLSLPGSAGSAGQFCLIHRNDNGSNQQTWAFTGSNGDFTSPGNVVAYSDIRVKKNIEVIENALDKIDQIRGVTYDRTDIEGVRHMGVIAQEVEKVAPEVITTSVNGDIEDFKAVAYGNLAALLIEGIKELRGELREIKSHLGL